MYRVGFWLWEFGIGLDQDSKQASKSKTIIYEQNKECREEMQRPKERVTTGKVGNLTVIADQIESGRRERGSLWFWIPAFLFGTAKPQGSLANQELAGWISPCTWRRMVGPGSLMESTLQG